MWGGWGRSGTRASISLRCLIASYHSHTLPACACHAAQVTRIIDDFRRKNMSQLQQLALDNKTSVGYGEHNGTAGDVGVEGQRPVGMLGTVFGRYKEG